MTTVTAKWVNGIFEPLSPIDWPDGTLVQIALANSCVSELLAAEVGIKDDPESIAEWCRGVDAIQPPIMSDDERTIMEQAFLEYRDYNREAMRRAMNGESQS
jgi:predicted DNA-binding antitoxin AbrB/MazE fold protein